jgi:hypothetical protein
MTIDKTIVPDEFITYIAEVMSMGAEKHGRDNWKLFNGTKSSHKDMHSSLFRHYVASANGELADHESGLHPAKHAAVRALMIAYRVEQLGYETDIKKQEDSKKLLAD